MNLYLRLLLVWLRNIPAKKRHHSHGANSRFRVLPHDLDAFGHMNNGRYHQIMDDRANFIEYVRSLDGGDGGIELALSAARHVCLAGVGWGDASAEKAAVWAY